MSRFKQIARNMFSNVSTRHVIENYEEYCSENATKRALVSYLTHPLLPPPSMRERVMFSNRGIAQEIARSLNELGYSVDIVDYRNTTWSPSKNYDLFVGHGGHNFEKLAHALGPYVCRIFFATGVYWKEWNRQEAKRLYDVAQQTGFLLPPERITSGDEETAHRLAHGTVCLGNQEAASTFSHLDNVVSINNAAYPLEGKQVQLNPFELRRKHFLYFAGRGNVHKGLDLLLEAFSGTDLHLHVCQHMQSEFNRVYEEYLSKPNIHLHGFVAMRSKEFDDIARRCNWIIMPTCAEGQPGSVLECMAYGLIPILPKTSNMDIDDFGVVIRELTLQSVHEALHRAQTWTEAQSLSFTDEISRQMLLKYSPEAFRSNFGEAIRNIIGHVDFDTAVNDAMKSRRVAQSEVNESIK